MESKVLSYDETCINKMHFTKQQLQLILMKLTLTK